MKKEKKMKKSYILLLMIVPFLLLIIMFNYIPLFGWIYAFFDYKPGIPLAKTEFVGLKFFALMISDGKDMLRVLGNTLIMSFLSILCSPLPLIFAVLMNEIRSTKYKKLVQTATTLPNFVSWVIVFSMAYALFSFDGMFNQLFAAMGIGGEPSSILANEGAVWFFQTGLSIWKTLGWSAIIYLAAISGIDGELYDSASVDGAGRFRRIWHITVPGLMPTFIILLLLSVSNMLSTGFDQYFIFKNPVVADKIEVLDVYIYRLGLANNDFSYATAIGMFKTVVGVTLLFTVNGLSKKIRGESIV